jgi:hypothetical protein
LQQSTLNFTNHFVFLVVFQLIQGLGFLGLILLGDAIEQPSGKPIIIFDPTTMTLKNKTDPNGHVVFYKGLLNGSQFFGIFLIMWLFPLGFFMCGGLASHLLLNHVGSHFFPAASSMVAGKLFRKGRRAQALHEHELDTMHSSSHQGSPNRSPNRSPDPSPNRCDTHASGKYDQLNISDHHSTTSGFDEEMAAELARIPEGERAAEFCCSPTIRRSTRFILCIGLGFASVVIVLISWLRLIRPVTNNFGPGLINVPLNSIS